MTTENLPADRRAIYDRLERSIGRTPFFRLEGIPFDYHCQVWVKAEYQNPSGSHYDREMVRLLRALEGRRRIWPNERDANGNVVKAGISMLETTTGNSGSAFAWLCRALDYPPPTIVIPADMPNARKAQIQSYGAKLVESPAGEYITGIEKTFLEFLGQDEGSPLSRPRLFCPMHWKDEVHSVRAMEECGNEILTAMHDNSIEVDYFVLALGNGSSSRGIGNVLHPSDDPKDPRFPRLVGMEPQESGIVTRWRKEVENGVEPGEYEEPTERHGIIGTGPSQPRQLYPNIRSVAPKLDTIELVSTPDAELMQVKLADQAYRHVGMSSAACVQAIHQMIRRLGPTHARERVFATIFYDPAWKYLDYTPRGGLSGD